MKAALIVGLLILAGCYVPEELDGEPIGEKTYITAFVKRVVDRETGVICYISRGDGISCLLPASMSCRIEK